MKELDLQSRILDEIRAVGGWGRKWASPLQAGVPDLITLLPNLGAVFIEVKIEKRKTFDKIPVKTTQLQRVELTKIEVAGGRGIVLVGVETPDCGRLYAVSPRAMMVPEGTPYTEWRRSKINLRAVELIYGYF